MPTFSTGSVPPVDNTAMRVVVLIAVWLGVMGLAHAQGAAVLSDCMGTRELQETVSSNGVVPPAAAVIAARRQIPDAEVVRANLCRSDNTLVYVIMALRKDGRIVQVMIDAPSGRIKSVR